MTDAPLSPRRHFLSFSLRSLLLFALLAGSIALVVIHSRPWALDRVLPVHALRVAMSPSGDRIAVIVKSGARILDAQSGAELAALEVPSADLNTIAFSPDGRRVITSSDDQTARLCDASTGRCLKVFDGFKHEIYDALFSPDGARIAVVCHGDLLRIYDAASFEVLVERQEPYVMRGYFSARFLEGGKKIVIGSNVGARICEAATLKELRVIAEPKAVLRNGIAMPPSGGDSTCEIEFSPDESRMTRLNNRESFSLWDVASGTKLDLPPFIARGAVFSNDGRRLLISDHGNHVLRVLDVGTLEELAVLGDAIPAVKGQRILDSRAYEQFGGAVFSAGGDEIFAPIDATIQVWKRRRPEYTWGYLLLPEAWLCAVLAVAFVASIVIGRRSRKAAAPAL